MKPRNRPAARTVPVIPQALHALEANPPDPNTHGVRAVLDWMSSVSASYAALGIDDDWNSESALDGWSGMPWALDPKTGDVIRHPRRGKKAGDR